MYFVIFKSQIALFPGRRQKRCSSQSGRVRDVYGRCYRVPTRTKNRPTRSMVAEPSPMAAKTLWSKVAPAKNWAALRLRPAATLEVNNCYVWLPRKIGERSVLPEGRPKPRRRLGNKYSFAIVHGGKLGCCVSIRPRQLQRTITLSLCYLPAKSLGLAGTRD